MTIPPGEPDAFAAQVWWSALRDPSGRIFRSLTAYDVVLESSLLVQPIEGRGAVFTVLDTVFGLHDRLRSTATATRADRVYLEWRSFGAGVDMAGVDVLRFDRRRRVMHIAMHVRPLPAALAISAELRRRLRPAFDPTFFHRGDPPDVIRP
jgi:hypothetical protein